MDDDIGCDNDRIAVCGGQTCVGMFGNGIVHDIVFHRKSDIFRHTWIPLRQGYTSDVESTFGVVSVFNRCPYARDGRKVSVARPPLPYDGITPQT